MRAILLATTAAIAISSAAWAASDNMRTIRVILKFGKT